MSNLAQEVANAMRPNLADRVVNYFAPVMGVKRMKARATQAIATSFMAAGRGGYTGASLSRRTTGSWIVPSGSADSDSLGDIPTLRNRSRDLLRNSPISAGAVGTVVMNVVGSGLALQSTPEAKRLGWTQEQAVNWAAILESEWRLWAETSFCDVTRTQNFYGLQALCFRSALESGDVFALLPMVAVKGSPYKIRVQIIEADRVANPKRSILDGINLENGNWIYSGIEKDGSGAPVAYHILQQHPGSLEGRGKWKTDRYPAFGEKTGRRNVLHIFDRLRPDQSRGVPYLSPVIEALHQLGRYTDAELMAAVVSGLFTVFVKTPAGEGLNITQSAAAESAGLVTSAGSSTSDPNNQKPLEMGAGLIVDLADGDEIQTADPKRPNTAFDDFVKAVLRQIGAALGLPFEVLVKHFTASYSAARAALLEAWRFYLGRRHWLAHFFCQPVFEAFMDEAVSIGRISAPGYFTDPGLRSAYLSCEWIGDAPGSIDPVKEINAAQKRVELGVSNRAIETMAIMGQVYDTVHAQLVREKQMRVRDGLEPAAGQTAGAPAPEEEEQENNGSDLEKGDREDE
ncbi:MAG: phage portal protein [Acidobacteria bacterium]|nr:phage portal protein [Acidobacteriota bacterium]